MVADWSDLTSAQQTTLLTSHHLSIATGAELLDSSLNVLADISKKLVTANGQVQWTGNATAHRGCSFTLRQRLNWGVDLVRLYRVWTDKVSGLQARAARGVFVMTAPGQDLGADKSSWQAVGQDRMSLLTPQIDRSYVVPALDSLGDPTLALAALRQAFIDAGIDPVTVLIDGSAGTTPVPTDMVYLLIAASDTSSASASSSSLPADSGQVTDSSGPATRLQIINDIAGLLAYRGTWADGNGYFRLGPYVDPGVRTPSATFGGVDSIRIRVNRSAQRALPQFNKWIFVNSTLPDVAGVPAVPVEGDGIYTVPATDDAIVAPDGIIRPTQISFAAADQDALVAMGDARVAADQRAVVTGTVSTVSYPPASHFDVFQWIDAALDESQWKAEATQWTDPLDGASTQWTVTKVG